MLQITARKKKSARQEGERGRERGHGFTVSHANSDKYKRGLWDKQWEWNEAKVQ